MIIVVFLVFVVCLVVAFRRLARQAESGNLDPKPGSRANQQRNRQPVPSTTQTANATSTAQQTELDTSPTDPWWHWRSYGGHFILLGGLLHKGWKKDILPIILGFVYLYIMLWLHVSKWLSPVESEYWHEVMRSGVFFLCVAAITLFALMCKPTGLFKFKFGKIGVFLAIGLGLAYFVPVEQLTAKKTASTTGTSDKSSAFGASPQTEMPATIASQPEQFDLTIPKHDETADEKIVRDFFAKSDLSEEDKLKMIKHAFDESGFHQMDPKNPSKVYVHQNNDKHHTYDSGVMQINSQWLPILKQKGPEYDIDTLQGNLNASLYVFEQQGHRAWRKYVGGTLVAADIPELIMAPVAPAWSTVKMIVRRFNFVPADNVSVCINEKCDPEHIQHAGPSLPGLHFGDTLVSIKYQADGNQPVPLIFVFTSN